MRPRHLGVKADADPEIAAMLLMIEKPRPTFPERAVAGVGAALRAAFDAVDAVLTGPFRALEHRRLADALAAMSDRDLRDIGLNRGDIRDIMAVPAGSDGTLFGAGRSQARR